jgi:hypothetical protein
MTSGLALAQRDGNFELETSSGRKYLVIAAIPELAFQRSQDPSVIVRDQGYFPRHLVTLKVWDLVKLSRALETFRTNREMVQSGLPTRVGRAVRSLFKEDLSVDQEAKKRNDGLKAKEAVSKILNEMYRASAPNAIATEEIHEIALMIAVNDPKHGQLAFETVSQTPGVGVPTQVAGFAINYVMAGQLFRIWGTNWCARLLQANNENKIVYVPALLGRIVLAGAGLLDGAGRVRDLVEGLDPGISPLISYLIFGDMKPDEGEALRSGAAAFQTKYQLK